MNKRLEAAQGMSRSSRRSQHRRRKARPAPQVLAKGFEGLKRGIAGVPDGLGKIQRGFGDLASRARDAFHAVGQIVTPLSAITSAGVDRRALPAWATSSATPRNSSALPPIAPA